MKFIPFTLVLAMLIPACGPKGPRPVETQMPAPKEPPAPPPVRAEKLDPNLVAAARKELDAALASRDPILRSHAIEAAQNTLREHGKHIYLAGLKDEQPPVRFASAMAVGQLQIAEARDPLLRMINDPNQRVGIAIRFALHRLGDTRFSKDLQESARDPNTAIRADTALVLGLLKEPTAVRVLAPMQRDRESTVRLQAAEAMWRLGDLDSLKMLIGASQSMFSDEQVFAIMALAAPMDRRVRGHVRAALTADHEEAQLQAARAMGMLGSDDGYAIAAAAVESKAPRQRALAALAFGAIGRNDAQELLRPLLKDDDADVRLCAAQAVLQLSFGK